MSPNNPLLGGAAATQPNSRGFEAMAMSPNGRYLYVVLEGAWSPTAGQLASRLYEFGIERRAFTGRTCHYRPRYAAHFVADSRRLGDTGSS